MASIRFAKFNRTVRALYPILYPVSWPEAIAAVEEIFRKRGVNMEHPELTEATER
jgi:hypothetical protein